MEFVEQIWARRKVGYMLDQIRPNGEKKELVDEVVALAKRYGITTPYTSYLIVPDGPMPVVPITPVIRPRPMPPRTPPPILMGAAPGAAPLHVAEFARQMQQKPGDLAANRDRLADRVLNGYGVGGRGSGMPGMIGGMGGMGGYGMGGMGGMGGYGMGGMGGMGEAKTIADTRDKKGTYDEARKALARGDINSVQAGKNAVDFALHNEKLRNQMRLEQTAQRNANGRQVLEIGGVWIDEKFDAKAPQMVVRALKSRLFPHSRTSAQHEGRLQSGQPSGLDGSQWHGPCCRRQRREGEGGPIRRSINSSSPPGE